MLLPWVLELLAAQLPEPQRDPAAGRVWHDYFVDEALARRDERVGEARFVFGGAPGDFLGGPAAEDDLDRALGAHHRDLGGGPGIVEVATEMFRRHDVIGAAIGLPRDYGDLGHGRLGISEEQFRAVLDDPR